MIRSTRVRIAILLATTAIAGCAGNPAVPRSGLSGTGPGQTVQDTRLTAGECLFGTPDLEAGILEGLAAALLPAVIDKGIGTLAQTLKTAGEGQEHRVAVERPLQLARGRDGMPECLQVARGRFFVDPAREQRVPVRAWLPDGTSFGSEDLWPALLARGLALAERPDLFLEIPLIRSSDGTAVAAAVRQFTYGAHTGSRAMRSDSEARDMSVDIAFIGLGTVKPEEIRVITLNLGKVRPGHSILYRTPDEQRDEWASRHEGDAEVEATTLEAPAGLTTAVGGGSGPQVSADQGDPGAEDTVPVPQPSARGQPVVSTDKMLPLTSQWMPLALTDTPKPVSIRVEIVDRQAPNRALGFAGQVLEAASDQTKQELTTALVPGEAERQRIERTKETRQAVQQYFTDSSAAVPVVAEYWSGAFDDQGRPLTTPEAYQLALQARAAQEHANAAAIIIEYVPPYQGPSLVNPDLHRPHYDTFQGSGAS